MANWLGDTAIHEAAIRALAPFIVNQPKLHVRVLQLLEDNNIEPQIIATTIQAITPFLPDDPTLRQAVEERLADSNSDDVRLAAFEALVSFIPSDTSLQEKVGELITHFHPDILELIIWQLLPFATTSKAFLKKLNEWLTDPNPAYYTLAITGLTFTSFGSQLGVRRIWSRLARNPRTDEFYHEYLAGLHSFSHRVFLNNLEYWRTKIVSLSQTKKGSMPLPSVPLGVNPISFTQQGFFQGRSMVIPDDAGPGASIYKLRRPGEKVEDLIEEARLLNAIHPDWGGQAQVIKGTIKPETEEATERLSEVKSAYDDVMLYYRTPDWKKLFTYPLDWKLRSADELSRRLDNAVGQLADLARLGYGYTGILEIFHVIDSDRRYDLSATPLGRLDDYRSVFRYANIRAGGDIVDLNPEHMLKLTREGKISANNLASAIREQAFQLALFVVLAHNHDFSRTDTIGILKRLGNSFHAHYGLKDEKWEKMLPVDLEIIVREAYYALDHPNQGKDLGHINRPISTPGLGAFAETIAGSVIEELLTQTQKDEGNGQTTGKKVPSTNQKKSFTIAYAYDADGHLISRVRSEENDPTINGLQALLQRAMPQYFKWDKVEAGQIGHLGKAIEVDLAYDNGLGLSQFLINLILGKYISLGEKPTIYLPGKLINWANQSGLLSYIAQLLINTIIFISGWLRYRVIKKWQGLILAYQQAGNSDVLARQVFNQIGLSPSALLQASYEVLLVPFANKTNLTWEEKVEINNRLKLLQEMNVFGFAATNRFRCEGKQMILPMPEDQQTEKGIKAIVRKIKIIDESNTRLMRKMLRFLSSA